jgi:hypothetical protein
MHAMGEGKVWLIAIGQVLSVSLLPLIPITKRTIMIFHKTAIAAILTTGLAGVSGQAFAHWSSGPFLYNDAGTNPMHLAPSNLPSTVTSTTSIDSTTALSAPTPGTNTATGTSYGSYTQTRVTSSDYGWIQGQDNSLWANSHDNKGLAFSLATTSHVSFTVTTLGTQASVIQTQAAGGSASTALSGLDWNPAFSIFKGLATQSSHEGGIGNTTLSNNLPGYINWSPYAAGNPVSGTTIATYNSGSARDSSNPNVPYVGGGTWGAYRSNGDWVAGRDISATAEFGDGVRIGTDQTLGGDNVRVLDYLDSASSAPGSHTVTWSGELGPGDYSIWVGGTNSANAAQQILNYQTLLAATNANDALAIAAANTAISNLRKNYGFSIQTTVAAVPVPGAIWLFGSALAGFVGFGRRKTTAV